MFWGRLINARYFQFSSVQSLSHVRLSATPWTAARQTFLSITNSWSLLKLMSIESMMPSNHLILCHPLLLPRKSQLLTLWLAFLETSFVLKLSRGSPQRHSYHSGNLKGFVPCGEKKTGKIFIIPQLLTRTVLLRFTQISGNRSSFHPH